MVSLDLNNLSISSGVGTEKTSTLSIHARAPVEFQQIRANHSGATGYSCAESTFVNVMERNHEFAL